MPSQFWRAGFTCHKVIGWGWLFVSMILADYSRYIVCWRVQIKHLPRYTALPRDALDRA